MMRASISVLLFVASAYTWAAPAYSVKTLAQLAIYPESRAVAQVVAENESRIAAEVGARIQAIPVKLGQSVRKGELLVKLDARQFQLLAQQADNQVELLNNRHKLAQMQFERAKSLHVSQFISADALEQRRTELAVLESELKIARNSASQARLSLEKTSIHAPFAGAVKERSMGEGEMAAPGQPIVTLVEHMKNEIRARVSDSDIAPLKASGAPAFRQGDKSYPVRIVRVAPVLDGKAQTRDVILQADTPLPSGSAGELVWASTTPHLPAAYLQQRERRLGIWIEEGGKPVFKPLPTAQAGRPVALRLPLDTRIVDEGRFALGAPSAPAAK